MFQVMLGGVSQPHIPKHSTAALGGIHGCGRSRRCLRSPAAASRQSHSLPHCHPPQEQCHQLRRVCACPCSHFHPAAPQNCLGCKSPLRTSPAIPPGHREPVPRCHIHTAVKSPQGWGHGGTTPPMKKYSPISKLNPAEAIEERGQCLAPTSPPSSSHCSLPRVCSFYKNKTRHY